jgi:hypothetical protein
MFYERLAWPLVGIPSSVLAALKFPKSVLATAVADTWFASPAKAANIQGPMEQRSSTGAEDNMTVGFPMPATLVRIPAERE